MKQFALYALVFELCALVLLALFTVNPGLQPLPTDTSLRARLLMVDSFSNRLYDESVERFAQRGDADIGGFMKAFQVEVHIAADRLIDGPGIERTAYPYVSHFNLQYTLGKWLTLGKPALAKPGIVAFEIICATGMALVVAGIALFAHREFGGLAGAGVVAIFVLPPAMLARAFSPYWLLFVDFLPFLAAIWLYPRARSFTGLVPLAVLVGALTALKALTGYEYLSNVVLGPTLAVLYHELRRARHWDKHLFAVLLRRALVLGLGSIGGFAIAAGFHVWKAAMFFGSLRQGVQAFVLPLTYSTMQSASGIRGEVAVGPMLLLRQSVVTFVTMNPLVSVPLYGALGVCLLLVLGRQHWSLARLWNGLDRRRQALWVCLAASALVSESWIVLAQRHSVVHPHINWVLGYMFVNVFAVIVVADLISWLRRGERGGLRAVPDRR